MPILTRTALWAALAMMLAYGADAAWVWARQAKHQDPTGSVQVRVLLAVPQKGGRIEFVPGGVEMQKCVHSVFPQIGLPPCWYAERHTRKEVDF
jgi:hypothetical protein